MENGGDGMIELRKRITLTDKNGKKTYDSGDLPSHSYVKQFLELLQNIFGDLQTPKIPVKSTTGVLHTLTDDEYWDSPDYPFSIDNDVDDANWGILIGDGNTTPEANDNFRLDSVIASGVAAGQVNYGLTNWDAAITVDGDECSWGFYRTMTNNSGGPVVVKEIGAYIRISASPLLYALILRDILTPTITIPDGETMTVKYTLKTEV